MSGDNTSSGGKPKKVTMGRIYAVSTLLAVIIGVPAAVVSVVMHYVIRAEIFVTLAAGLITLFIAMGVGIKLSKKLAGIQEKKDSNGT